MKFLISIFIFILEDIFTDFFQQTITTHYMDYYCCWAWISVRLSSEEQKEEEQEGNVKSFVKHSV